MTSWLTLSAVLLSSAHAVEVSVTDKGHASNPTWSPNGDHLAFELNNFDGSVALYVIKIQAGNPVGTPQKVNIPGGGSSFSTGGSVAAAPVWHPEGTLIFEGSNAGGATRLYFFSPGGQSAAELLSTSQIGGDLSWPAISPDGKSVAFVSDATGSGDIYIWDRSSNQVTQGMASPFTESAPEFDGSGGKIAYSRKNRGSEDVFILESGTPTPRVGGGGDQTRPAWAGGSVLFFSNERGEDHWDVVASSGPGAKQVLARDVRLPLRATPALSPDGGWVAYAMSDPEKAKSVYLQRVDGSKTVEIPTGLIAVGEPALVSAGGRTFLSFTALPGQGSDWRQLHVIDITGRL